MRNEKIDKPTKILFSKTFFSASAYRKPQAKVRARAEQTRSHPRATTKRTRSCTHSPLRSPHFALTRSDETNPWTRVLDQKSTIHPDRAVAYSHGLVKRVYYETGTFAVLCAPPFIVRMVAQRKGL